MSPKRETKLVVSKSLGEDIKRRLVPEEIVRFLGSLDLAQVRDAEDIRYLLSYPQRLSNGWTSTEVNYLLYGREMDNDLICTNAYFEYYNFFHYINMNDPEQMARKDICKADIGIAPHVHTLAYNPEKNRNLGKNLLGTLHNHNHLGFPSRQKMKSVSAVGFSPDDEFWNNWYLERYGTDGRKLAFVIYYSDNDFYMGAFKTRHTQLGLLNIVIE